MFSLLLLRILNPQSTLAKPPLTSTENRKNTEQKARPLLPHVLPDEKKKLLSSRPSRPLFGRQTGRQTAFAPLPV